jgi:hypothetical protein
VLNVGSDVVAIKNIGPVREGTPGVITAVTHAPFLFFWTRRLYLCTFAGRINLAVRRSQIGDCERGPARWRSFGMS